MSKHLLSKSTFIRSLQCQKSLFLYRRHKELQDKVSVEQQAVFSRGHHVGFLARRLFPGGVDAGWKNPKFYRKSVNLTQKLIVGGINVIYEAAFISDNILVAADIMVRDELNEWHLYEVKSSLKPGETFLRDAALQYRVLSKAGIELKSINLVHLNKYYCREGKLSIPDLFTIADVTEQIKIRQAFVLSGIVSARETLLYKDTPEVNIGPHCFEPYTCDFLSHCWQHIPDPSIFNIEAMEAERKWKLYNKGILSLADIPADFPMTLLQQAQYEALLHNKIIIKRNEILKFFDKVKFPAIFLDFNAARPAIPLINGTHPYQNIPFQFHLFKMNHIAAPAQEIRFLAQADQNTEKNFITAFLQQTSEIQSIIIFDKNFECRIFKDMAVKYPDLQDQIQDCLKKMIDLSDIFRKGMFFHPGLKSGIKLNSALACLGVMNEEEPEINSHYMAGLAFEQCFNPQDIFSEQKIRTLLFSFGRYQAKGVMDLFLNLRIEAMKEEAELAE